MSREGDKFFCDRCVRVMKVPGQGKGSPGAVAVAVLTEDVMWCKVCVNRHGLPPEIAREDAPVSPAPEARDDKESPKDERPVRRPSRPRPKTRNLMDVVASAAAPQVAKKWAAEMPGPSPIRRPSVAEKYGKPAPAPITAAQARARQLAFAQAYAVKHGRLMAPPTRRGVVPHEEIAAAVAAAGEDAPPVYDHGQLLTAPQAADYLGIASTTFSKWKKLYGCPVAERTVTGLDRGGVALYRMDDVEALRSDAEAAQSAKAREAAAPSVAARAARVSERMEDLHRLLAEGRSREEAARIAGYRSVNSARAAACGAGRADIQALLRTRVKAGPAEVEERIRVLEELLTNGDAVGDAWKRAGWTSRSAAERSLDRHGRHDLASWIRTGTRPAAAQERAA